MVAWHISPRASTAALVALVALDVALVATALRSTHANGIDVRPVSVATTSTDPSAVTPTGTAPLSSASLTAANAPLEKILVAVDEQRAWRISAGSCSSGGASLARTEDGGKTWVKGDPRVRRIIRVRPSDNRVAFIVGADSDCVAKLQDTSDGGGTWTSGGDVGRAWFRDPENPLVVWAPGSATSQPCGTRAVLDLAVDFTTGGARVLCADGLVRSATDSGSRWADVGKVTGAVALAVPTDSPAETYVAQLGAPKCAGVQILRVSQRLATSCIKVAIPKDSGQISLSLPKGSGWLSVDGTTMRSTDNLATWVQS